MPSCHARRAASAGGVRRVTREFVAWNGPTPQPSANDNPPPPRRRPPLLVTGALRDPRVQVREPAKWVQVLRATDPDRGAGTDPTDPTSPAPVLVPVETGEGSHHGPAGRFGHVEYETEVAARVLAALS